MSAPARAAPATPWPVLPCCGCEQFLPGWKFHEVGCPTLGCFVCSYKPGQGHDPLCPRRDRGAK